MKCSEVMYIGHHSCVVQYSIAITLFVVISHLQLVAQGTFIVKFADEQQLRQAVQSNKQLSSPFSGLNTAMTLSFQTASSNKYIGELRKYVRFTATTQQQAQRIMAQLRAQYKVEYADAVRTYKVDAIPQVQQVVKTLNDPLADEQWYLAKMRIQQAWQYSTGKSVIVAFIDTGVNWEHPDLVQQLWVNQREDINQNGRFEAWSYQETRNGIKGDIDGIDNDGNGYIDDVIGYNFVDQYVGNLSDDKIRDGFPYDDQGHGTSVAGVIGAQPNNNIGIAGVAPGAALMALKAFDVTGNAEDDDVAAAIVYAVLNGAKVINMSFGDNVKAPIVEDAIRYAYAMNVTLVSSSGNGGGLGTHYPSDYNEVISVGSSNQDDRRSVFSSYNSQLSLMAPGEGIITTNAEGGYRKVNGTSFSSPCVAAIAALLLEKQPWLTPAMIRSMLCTSSDAINGNSWTLQYGNGRVNAEQALKNFALSSIEFLSPVPDTYIQRDTLTQISYTAALSNPLCTSWKLQLMPGERMDSLVTIDSGNAKNFNLSQERNLFQATGRGLRDTTYSLLLTAELVNGRSLSVGTRLRLINIRARIEKADILTPWKDGKRIVVVTAKTSSPASTRAIFRNSKGDTLATVTNNLRWGEHHAIVVDNMIDILSATSCTVYAESMRGLSDTINLLLNLQPEYAPKTGFRQLQQRTNRLFATNATTRYNKNPNAFIGTDFSSDERAMGEYEIRPDTIRRVSSTSQTFFPRGIGDSNGNGVAEVWAQSGPKSLLFERGSTAFSTIIFGDSLNADFWAARMADLDGDGREELIGYRTNRRSADRTIALSDAMEVWTNKNGTYQLLATLDNPSTPAIDKKINNFTAPGCAVGDFDADGKRNIAFTDSDGDVCVYEWNGTAFEREAVVELTGFSAAAGTEFTIETDVTGDGVPEILVATPANPTYNTDGEYDTPLWLIRVLGFEQSSYVERARDYVFGTRYGSPFRNAVAAGNVDGVKGDELLIGVFPSLYAMSIVGNQLKPMWYAERVWTGGIIVADINGNGRNDLGFVRSSSLQTEFWEYASSPDSLQPPTGLRAEYRERDGKRSLRISWQPVIGAKAYSILMKDATKKPSNVLRIRSTQTTLDVPFNQIPEPITYLLAEVSVQSLSDTVSNAKLSLPSDTIIVSLQKTVLPIFTETSRIHPTTLACRVQYSGKLSDAVFPPDVARVFNESNIFLPNAIRSVISMGESQLLLIFRDDVPNGQFTIHLNGNLIRDEWNNPTGDTIFQAMYFVINQQRRMSFTLGNQIHPTYITMNSSDEIAVDFRKPEYYSVQPTGTITSITASDSIPNQYIIHFAEPLVSRGYEYVLSGDTAIKSTDGKQLSATLGNSIRWTYPIDDVNCAFAYPQPAVISRSTTLTFGCVRQGSKVEIFTIEGIKIGELTSLNATGGVEWEMRFPNGSRLTSGVYTFRVIDSNGVESALQKFMVQQ